MIHHQITEKLIKGRQDYLIKVFKNISALKWKKELKLTYLIEKRHKISILILKLYPLSKEKTCI